VRAKKGSGIVVVLIKHEVLNALCVSVLDDTQEDSLWVHLRHKVTGEKIRVGVCYLVPENSSRGSNAQKCYEICYRSMNINVTDLCLFVRTLILE
jgi:hypothetical protein